MSNHRQPIETALGGVAVETKIDDGKGVRNVQDMCHNWQLCWFTDGSMYVYYEPTHWRVPQ